MQLGNAFGRVAGSVIEVTGIRFQCLPEYDGVRLELRRLEGTGRDAAKPTDRTIHQIARHLLSTLAPSDLLGPIEGTAINPNAAYVGIEQSGLVSTHLIRGVRRP